MDSQSRKLRKYFDGAVVEKLRLLMDKVDTTHGLRTNMCELSRTLLSDSELEVVFRKMIREQLKRLSLEKQSSFSTEEEMKAVKQKVKHSLLKLIRREYCSFFRIRHKEEQKMSQAIDVDEQNEKWPKRKCYYRRELMNLFCNERIYHFNNKKKEEVKEDSQQEEGSQSEEEEQERQESQQRNQDILTPIQQQQQHFVAKKYNQYQQLSDRTRQHLQTVHKPRLLASLTPCSPFILASQLGHFAYGDRVSRILDVSSTGGSQEEQILLIEWEERKNGQIPTSSMLPLSQWIYYSPLEAGLYWRKLMAND